MSVSVPSMNAAMGRMSGPLSSPLSSLLGYEGSLMVGTTSTSPRTSPHHSAAWGCPSIQVKQEPTMKQEASERDHDSSGVSSMAHGSSFLSALTNTSPSSSSSAGSPPGPAGHGHYGYHHAGLQGLHGHAAHPSLPAHQGGLSPRRASPASPPRPTSTGPMHSTPLTGSGMGHQGHQGHQSHQSHQGHQGLGPASPHHAASPGPNPAAAKVPRPPGSVDDNSRSSSSSNSEDDAEEQVRRLRATLDAANANGSTSLEAPLQCQLCSFNADCRESLSEHIASHFKCSLCDHAAGSADGLRAHLADVHDLQMPQGTPPSHPSPEAPASDEGYLEQEHDEDLEGVATPRVNSQGKVKTFRCKQCEFVAVTKLDFWEHTKQHIKQEKMLCCPKCPFVTEYKHHLEYHLRNHFNSKPFKCDKCSYSCVNKSMLNSHLKSHSNVYQYRCADCTYATKYCHSLKLHLRKYGHQPSMVLNPDGTPNPLPIIDVYGTRRGPKTKHSKAAQQALQQQQMQQQQQVQLPPQQFPHGMFPNPYGLPSIFPYAAAAPAPQDMPLPTGAAAPTAAPAVPAARQGSPVLHRCNYCDMTTPDAEVLAQHMFVHAEAMQSNLMQYFYANNNNYHQEDVKDFMGKAMAQPVRQGSPPAGPVAPAPPQSPPRTPSSPRSAAAASPAAASPVSAAPGRPLDLSKPEHAVEEVRETKNRRKGRAFKLERIAMRLQQQSSGDEAEPEHPVVKAPRLGADAPVPASGPAASPVHAPAPVRGPASSPEHKARSPSPPTSPAAASGKEEYNCSYCDIAFGDIVMYTMHMGYHGYQDPFKCNMCGQQTTDKVSFFLHIARSSHS